MKVLFIWPNKDSFGFKPLGISLLSAIARSLGWETRLFDATPYDLGFVDRRLWGQQAKLFKPVDLVPYGHKKIAVDLRESFIKILDEFNPDVLALSVLSEEFLIASNFTAIAKEYDPNLPIIWGGKFPTLNPENTVTLHGADFACVGEGLEAFQEILVALSEKGDLYKINNIWSNKNGTLIKNNLRPLKKSLDDLPYLYWDIFDNSQFYKPFDGKVYKSGDHMLNWGCPYHCSYCINQFYHEAYNNKYHMRRYGIRRIIEELKFLKNKYELEFFKFHDEDFLLRPLNNLRDLSEAYRQEVNLPFVIETNPKSVTEENVRLLKDMNCVSASVAIETGSTELRKNILNRVDSEKDVVRSFSLLKDVEIRTSSFNMLGIPFETRETYNETVNLNRKANVQYPLAAFFYPFDGTVLRDIAIKEDFFDPEDKERMVFRRDQPALRFKNISERELIEMRNVFVLYIKLPEDYELFIKRSEKLDKLGTALRDKLLEIYDKTVLKNNGWYSDDGFKSIYLGDLNDLCKKHHETLT